MGAYNILPYLGNYEGLSNEKIRTNGGVMLSLVKNSASGETQIDYGVSTDPGNLMKAYSYFDRNSGRWYSGVCCRKNEIGTVMVRYLNGGNLDGRYTYVDSPMDYYDDETGLYYTCYAHPRSVFYIFDPAYFESLREALDAMNDGVWTCANTIPVVYGIGGGYTHNFLRYHSIVKLRMNHLLTREEVA